MLPTLRSPLGAPGAFALPEMRPPTLHPQRLDGCAFVGVAPRGPARVPEVDAAWPPGWRQVVQATRPLRRSVPVAVRSFDEYLHSFGGFEGPGLLPHAVASYFEQGGRIAWVVRVVSSAPAAFDTDCARGKLPAVALDREIEFVARNPGAWGNALRVQIAFDTETVGFEQDAMGRMLMALRSPIAVGSTLRLTDALGLQTLAVCTGLERLRDPDRAREQWRLVLDVPPPNPPVAAEIVSLRLDVDDGAGRRETHARLALVPEHPRGLASVLCESSSLLWPARAWAGDTLRPLGVRVDLLQASSDAFLGGDDHYGALLADDFFDPDWSAASDETGSGLACIANTEGVTQLVLPDLFVPAAWAGAAVVPEATLGSAGAEFGQCVGMDTVPAAAQASPSELAGLILDPRTEAGLTDIVALQQRVLDFCEQTRNHIALLDVPPGLSQARIERWRAKFDSCWLAAYHPWLIGSRRQDQGAGATVDWSRQLPPSAVAAGIIARRELARGIHHGPANEVAQQVLHLAEPQPEGRVDALHPLGINGYERQAQGIVLVGARTLSREACWRQLSVRRLVLMIERALLAQMQWAVFEPQGAALERDLRRAIESLLRGLFRAGAFAGRSETESFFVRVLNERARSDRGELVVEIGVAPAEPLEFILVRLRRKGDGTLALDD